MFKIYVHFHDSTHHFDIQYTVEYRSGIVNRIQSNILGKGSSLCDDSKWNAFAICGCMDTTRLRSLWTHKRVKSSVENIQNILFLQLFFLKYL